MEITFTNGNDRQKDAVRTATHLLLNYPHDAIPLQWQIEFVADPDASLHNEFMVTNWTYDSSFAETRIRNDAPSFQKPQWNGLAFFYESVIHELGHALFANLTQHGRLNIAALFGVDTDDVDTLTHGAKWENRVIEGIAETFKDAFLPRRHRRYSNRTHKHVKIIDYPRFRRIFRDQRQTATIDDIYYPVFPV
jgi:hypothetical protein